LKDFGERKRHAFELFENGNYEESYALCMALLGENQEPQIEVLAATNLFNLGRLEEAELHFRPRTENAGLLPRPWVPREGSPRKRR